VGQVLALSLGADEIRSHAVPAAVTAAFKKPRRVSSFGSFPLFCEVFS